MRAMAFSSPTITWAWIWGVVVFPGDIADEREDFNLFVERDFDVCFAVAIEIAESDIAEGTDGGEVGGVL